MPNFMPDRAENLPMPANFYQRGKLRKTLEITKYTHDLKG